MNSDIHSTAVIDVPARIVYDVLSTSIAVVGGVIVVVRSIVAVTNAQLQLCDISKPICFIFQRQ